MKEVVNCKNTSKFGTFKKYPPMKRKEAEKLRDEGRISEDGFEKLLHSITWQEIE